MARVMPWVFGARIVVGDDDLIGQLIGDRAHARALAGIPIAAAAEHAPQLALAMLARGAQGLGKRIGRMGVVDDGGGLVARVGDHHFHSSRGRLALRQRAGRVDERYARREQTGNDDERVLGVESAHELGT